MVHSVQSVQSVQYSIVLCLHFVNRAVSVPRLNDKIRRGWRGTGTDMDSGTGDDVQSTESTHSAVQHCTTAQCCTVLRYSAEPASPAIATATFQPQLQPQPQPQLLRVESGFRVEDQASFRARTDGTVHTVLSCTVRVASTQTSLTSHLVLYGTTRWRECMLRRRATTCLLCCS